MVTAGKRLRVGEIRPSQLLFSNGVGAIIDLPNLGVIVLGLDYWGPPDQGAAISEPRLLRAVRGLVGPDVERLQPIPHTPEETSGREAGPGESLPVAPFPRWLLCPFCRTLGTVDSGLFELIEGRRSEQARYAHRNCSHRTRPTAVPARFLTACQRGHLDDFPWSWFVHGGAIGCPGPFSLVDNGVGGEADDIFIRCAGCGANKAMSQAFSAEGRLAMPLCRGRRPQLGDFEEAGCKNLARAILLGASNIWFPLVVSALAIPATTDRLRELVERSWHVLAEADSAREIGKFRAIGALNQFAEYSEEEIWEAVISHRQGADEAEDSGNLRLPEWRAFTAPDKVSVTDDFRVRPSEPPPGFSQLIAGVALAERIREVRALVGFARIESPGDLDAASEIPDEQRAPISRGPMHWVPAVEVRGEGIFVRFNEIEVQAWEAISQVRQREQDFRLAHRRWRHERGLDPEEGFPGIRYIMLHTFAHALIRQLVHECGYAAASLRERIYAFPASAEDGPTAGILLYTAATDSEGTLGELVSSGSPLELNRHVAAALERIGICASDPLCAEHEIAEGMQQLHGAACHACLFASETSCERGNKFLDRALLVPTLQPTGLEFFPA